MGYPICLGRCSICAIDEGCLAGNGDDDYVHARKDQVIKRLDEGRYKDDRGMMIKYLKNKYNYDYNIPNNTHHIEIDEEEYAKHHADDIKNSCTVNSFTDDRTLNTFIDLTSDDGLFTLELNATEINEDKKDEVAVTTLASTIIRISDYSDKETFLNHIKNILSREFPKATEGILSQYYDSIPREPDLTTKISNILREAGVDESKIPDTAIALIDTMIDPDNE